MHAHRRSSARLYVWAGVLAALLSAGGTAAGAADDAEPFAVTKSGARITVGGTVFGEPESVAFSGPVQIGAKTVTDPGFNDPVSVELSIDLSAVSGIGLSTGKKYVTQSPANIQRPLSYSDDVVEIDFPFHAMGSSDFSAYRMGVARFELGFHVTSRNLIVARGSIESSAPVDLGASGP